jgi:hypothetical protein
LGFGAALAWRGRRIANFELEAAPTFWPIDAGARAWGLSQLRSGCGAGVADGWWCGCWRQHHRDVRDQHPALAPWQPSHRQPDAGCIETKHQHEGVDEDRNQQRGSNRDRRATQAP